MSSAPPPVSAIHEWIDHWADVRPDHPAVVFEGATITYETLAAVSSSLASSLESAGVGVGDRVGFCGLNRVEQLCALFACSQIGAILLVLNNRLTEPEVRHQLDDADPAIVLVTDGFGTLVAGADPSRRVRDLDTKPIVPARRAGDDVSDGGPERPVLMVYTSGTTGRPKGAVHSQRSLCTTIDNGARHQHLGSSDVVLAVLPLFHVGGLNIQVLPALAVGATVVLQRAFDPDDALGLLERHRPSHSLLVPAIMEVLLAHPRIDEVDLSCLRGIGCGSSIVPERLIRGFLDRGVPIGQVYGTTETGPTSVVLEYADGEERVGSCGRSTHHTEVRVVDASGRDVPEGEPGEVWLRGDNVFLGYWRNDAATDEAMVDGWYRTGDVGRRVDGFLYIEDRLKDMLISGGENVYPAEVENVLGEHPAFAEVTVVGRPDRRWGEVPVAVAVLADGAVAPSISELREWCAGRLAGYKRPADLRVVDALPRTALGKVRKHLLSDLVAED